MTKIKVIGAGSIGNHLSHAARSKGWEVALCDNDVDALERTKTEIYPQRYGEWDEDINLYHTDDVPKGGFDYIFIGTPPDTHIDIALSVLDEDPKVMLIEKPVCKPDLEKSQMLLDELESRNIRAFVGYDHVVGKGALLASELMKNISIAEVETLDVEIREHWGGIFNAHPWLKGPVDTYLGYWKRGGGACAEHSHGINLWQHYSHEIEMGRIIEVSATLDYVDDSKIKYDKLCLLNLKTEKGLIGRVIQDVVTQPPRKWARLQGSNSYVEWYCNIEPGVDAVKWENNGEDNQEKLFNKTRPDDFIQELNHIEKVCSANEESPISLKRGMDTMMVIAAAHLSSQNGRVVKIDYSKGYRQNALTFK